MVLSELSKDANYTDPIPRQLAHPDEVQEDMRSHKPTRARMAHAADQGVDVIEVLLQDFTSALARQGLKRVEIERMKKDAIRNIDHRREISGSRDIVDMVMDRAMQTKPANFGRKPARRDAQRIQRVSGLKHTLQRLPTHEATWYEDAPEWVRARDTNMRRRVERELVFDVTQLALSAGTMRPNVVAQWRQLYTKKAQADREANGHRIDVLNELP